MKIYNVDFKILVRLLVPTFLRLGDVLKAFYDSIAGGFAFIYGIFTSYRMDVKDITKYNYQVCYLEAMLNDKYDSKQRRIYISTQAVRQFLMIYKKEENLPVMISQTDQGEPVMIHRLEEIENKNTFVVNIPTELISQQDKIRASVNVYRLASREFVIKSF